MIRLPEEFIKSTRETFGDERFERYIQAFDEEPPVSIRLNPRKVPGGQWQVEGGEQVPWCPEGYYLQGRPQFTFDPLLHAGCYYVQEAASMFISHVLRQYVHQPVTMLDLCAAPGGKSTAAIASVPAGSTLHANEPDRRRCSILQENISKWGYPASTVTNNYPRDYSKSGQTFDVVIADVPCSGEGMFRRDEATIGEWSPQHVDRCRQLQREIVSDAWTCLRAGGLLIYSTCTFNTQENEENVSWMMQSLDGADIVPVSTHPEWHITGSLLDGFTAPVYRFIPGITRSEGLFVAVLQKRGSGGKVSKGSSLKALPPLMPAETEGSPRIDVDYATALAYLRGEAVTLPPDTPRGLVAVAFEGFTLGPAKNIGSRANNLYPKPWRIKTTHIPTEYEPILKLS